MFGFKMCQAKIRVQPINFYVRTVTPIFALMILTEKIWHTYINFGMANFTMKPTGPYCMHTPARPHNLHASDQLPLGVYVVDQLSTNPHCNVNNQLELWYTFGLTCRTSARQQDHQRAARSTIGSSHHPPAAGGSNGRARTVAARSFLSYSIPLRYRDRQGGPLYQQAKRDRNLYSEHR